MKKLSQLNTKIERDLFYSWAKDNEIEYASVISKRNSRERS